LTEVALVGLDVSDPPERWKALGFVVGVEGRVGCNGVTVTLGIAPPGRGIAGWTLAGLAADGDIDGLSTRVVPAGEPRWIPAARVMHSNGVVGIDHVVVTTPRLDAFADALAARGLPLRRRTEVRGRRMGFRRLGSVILEVVEDPDATATAFWGITFAVVDRDALDALCAGNRFVGEPRHAVQPGRHITTVSREAGLSTRVAFIDSEPPRDS
jgi:hypothetical protein